jgi:hypothetical protein
MNIDLDPYVQAAAGALARDIDEQVLMSALGWHELVISEGRVYGSRYLTVHPTNSNQWNNMMQWAVDTFGPSSNDGVWTPNMRWYANNAKFWFRNQKDLDWFIMRWSS